MKRLFTLLLISGLIIKLSAQVPQKLSYQGIIRNSTGGLVTNHAVGMKISILQGSSSGTAVYVETHTTTTNANGLATIEIGGGGLVSGNFNTISWGSGIYFLKTETDPSGGTSYTIVGTSQLLSVPYALNSKTSDGVADNSITSSKIVDGTITGADIANNAVTSAKIADNSIVTADLTDNIITPAKISNLAVTTDKLANTSVTMDKIANLAVTTGKLAAGSVTTEKINAGAVTGPKIAQAGATSGQVLKWNNTTWAPGNDEIGNGLILPFSGTVANINTALEIINTGNGKGIVGSGSFGVYGLSATENNSAVYGYQSASAGTGSGVIGLSSSLEGRGVYGSSNYIGVKGFAGGITGTRYGVYGESGSENGYGVYAINTSTSGGIGIFGQGPVGVMGKSNSSSGFSGYFTIGRFFVNDNVGIGEINPECKLHIVSPVAGGDVLKVVQPGSGNYIIRMRESTSTGSGLIYIYDDENNPKVQFYAEGPSFINGGSLGIGTETPTQALHVVGNAYKTVGGTTWATSSDSRLKNILGNYTKGLEEILALQPVRYIYLADNPRNLDSDIEQVGFVAQDVLKIFPEAVTEARDGYLDFNMHEINVALVNAVKELKAENEELKARLKRLEAMVGK